MNVCFIIPYFGNFPNYFQLTLNSMKVNSKFNWIIFTDNKEEYNIPSNVKIVKITFDEIKNYIKNKLGFEICLDKPYKFCDFKPAYGYIFKEYLEEYTHWGHCDLDMIMGKLDNFITNELLENYDKLFIYGHMTIYKNNYQNNKIFLKGRYEEIFKTNKGYGFDELWHDYSINNLFLNENKSIYTEKLCADINPDRANFQLSLYHDKNYSGEEFFENIKESIFLYNNGKIERFFIKENELKKLEYMYIHLQKRKMRLLLKEDENNKYLIQPNIFRHFNNEIDSIEKFEKIKKYSIDKEFIRIYFKGLKNDILRLIKKLFTQQKKKKIKKYLEAIRRQ